MNTNILEKAPVYQDFDNIGWTSNAPLQQHLLEHMQLNQK